MEFGIWEIFSQVVEFRILGFSVIQKTTQGIQNPTNDWKESGIHYLKSGIHGLESRIQELFEVPDMGLAVGNNVMSKLRSKLVPCFPFRQDAALGYYCRVTYYCAFKSQPQRYVN